MQEYATMEMQLELLKEKLAGMPEGTAVYRYLEYLNAVLGEKAPLFVQEYAPIVRQNAGEDAGPFLSVITRTRGNRPEMLRETLLSLCGQTDMDFEVLLIGHKLDAQQEALLQTIIGEQPPSLRSRIRLLQLEEGNRTKPLNVGFAHARGQYIAVLDDDDIVFDHWVESFRKAARRRPGAMLHAYVLVQDWMRIPSGQTEALRAVHAPADKYCKPFDMLRQLWGNRCPLHGVAFPAYVFQKLGLIFDESLSTAEDWDYILRVSALTGVEDIPEATALYRMWVNTDNSYAAHGREEWDDNDRYIWKKLEEIPILLPPGTAKTAVALQSRLEYLEVHVVPHYEHIVSSLRWRVISAIKLPSIIGRAARKLVRMLKR